MKCCESFGGLFRLFVLHVSRFTISNVFAFVLLTQISDNSTTSVLTFTPSLKDHNKTLTCRAENPKIAAGVTEAVSIIDVTCEYADKLKFPTVLPALIEPVQVN